MTRIIRVELHKLCSKGFAHDVNSLIFLEK